MKNREKTYKKHVLAVDWHGWGVKSVVIHLNFGQQAFDWVDLGVSAFQKQLAWDALTS